MSKNAISKVHHWLPPGAHFAGETRQQPVAACFTETPQPKGDSILLSYILGICLSLLPAVLQPALLFMVQDPLSIAMAPIQHHL